MGLRYRAAKTQKHPVKVKMETDHGTWIVLIDHNEIVIKPYRRGWDMAARARPNQLYMAAQQYNGPTERERQVRREPPL